MTIISPWLRRVWTIEGLLISSLFVLLSGLALLFPASGDDWAWGSSLGMERLDSYFSGYNGRYLGNFAVLFLTRVTWLTPFVIAGTICLLVRLLVEIAGLTSPAGYLAAGALVLVMPLGQWRQTVVWVSGFSNYVLAALVLLVFVLTIQCDWLRPRKPPLSLAVLLLFFAVAGQLFMEHVTLFILVASLANVAVQFRRASGVSRVAVAWAVGAVVGAVVMFSNSAYRTVAAGGEANQGLAASDSGHGAIWAIIVQGSGGVSQYAVTANTVLNLVLFALVLSLAWRHRDPSGHPPRGPLVVVVLAGVAVIVSIAVQTAIEPGHYYGTLSPWSWIAALAQLVAILLTARTLIQDTARAVTVGVLGMSVLVLVAPMAVVTPFGPRNFLPSYLLLVLVALLLLAELLERSSAPVLTRLTAGLGAVVALATISSYFAVYVVIHREVEHRADYLRNAADEGFPYAYVYTLPFQDHVHNPDPLPQGGQQKRFKRYYGLPLNLEIRLVDRYANRVIIPSPAED